MILSMCGKLVVALLILGWISLSGFDLVEDLDEIPGQVAVSSASPDDSSTSKRGGLTTSSSLQTAHNRVMLRSFVLPRLFLIPLRFSISADTFNSTRTTASF